MLDSYNRCTYYIFRRRALGTGLELRFAESRRTAKPSLSSLDMGQMLDQLSDGGSDDDSIDDILKGHASWKAYS